MKAQHPHFKPRTIKLSHLCYPNPHCSVLRPSGLQLTAKPPAPKPAPAKLERKPRTDNPITQPQHLAEACTTIRQPRYRPVKRKLFSNENSSLNVKKYQFFITGKPV